MMKLAPFKLCAMLRSSYGKQLAALGYDRKEFVIDAEERDVKKLLDALKIGVPAEDGANQPAEGGTEQPAEGGAETSVPVGKDMPPMPKPHRRRFENAWKEEVRKLKQEQLEAPDTEPRVRFLEKLLRVEHKPKTIRGKSVIIWELTFKYHFYKRQNQTDTTRTIFKRYSEVESFHNDLQGAVQAAQKLPQKQPLEAPDIPFPPKSDSLTKRKPAFEKYFNDLIRWEQSQMRRGHDRPCDVAWLQVLDVSAAFFNFEDPQAASIGAGDSDGSGDGCGRLPSPEPEPEPEPEQ